MNGFVIPRHARAGACALLAAALWLVPSDGDAAFWKRRPETPSARDRAYDHDLYPTMSIRRGTLRLDARGGWTLAGLPLCFEDAGPRRRVAGCPAALREGCSALVLGHVQGDRLVVHGLDQEGPDEMARRGRFAARRCTAPPEALGRGGPR